MHAPSFHVAIVGGGLCGLSLAIALTRRSIPFTLYEARSSFTEIGAGINVAPNALKAFKIIDPAIADAIFGLVTRNVPGRENIWMTMNLGAPSGEFEDGYVLHSLEAPPTGNMTASRNELLKLLAGSIDIENARFNKKLMDLRQDHDGVDLVFEDGSVDRASAVIGCDGAHSIVRRLILGPEHPATTPGYSETAGYRAIFPMNVHEELVGKDKAHNSNIWVGPDGYVIMYPIDGGKNANIGLWPSKRGNWDHQQWVLPKQKQKMLKDLAAWGPTMQRLMARMGDDTALWASFHHSVQPESFFKGRVCMIGDASHLMTPHQGQGAAQSMEDACVMAEVMHEIDSSSSNVALFERLEAAFSGYQAIRKPRFERVSDSSIDAHFGMWARFWRPDLAMADVEDFQKEAEERFRWIWDSDIEGQGMMAKEEMRKILKGCT